MNFSASASLLTAAHSSRSDGVRKYASGDATISVDFERARYYFRLCAARGMARCQFELGRLLIPVPGTAKGDAVQAVAWLELAGEGGLKEAEPLLAPLRESLAPEDRQRAEKLKAQLLRH